MEGMLRIGARSTTQGEAAAQILGSTTGAWPINIVAGLNGAGNDQIGTGNDKVWSYHGGWVDTGITYAENQWQKWQIDWTVGSSTFALKVDNATAASVPLDTSGSYSALSNFWFGTGEGSTMYVGAIPIPEPCSLALLSSGLLGLLAYAWRKRK